MYKTQFTFWLLLIAAIAIPSCIKKNYRECLVNTTARVSSVKGPNKAVLNEQINLTVNYYLTNECGIFGGLEAATTGYTTFINLKAKYEGCVCSENIKKGQTNFTFKASRAGVYYLNFSQPDHTLLVHTLIVN